MRIAAICTLVAVCLSLQASDALVPRTVVGLYTSRRELSSPRETDIHRFAEMPLNHLGLKIEYHDSRAGLPDLDERNDIRGILIWLDSDFVFADANAYTAWLMRQYKQGRKVVVIGSPGFPQKLGSSPSRGVNHFWRQLGMQSQNDWEATTYDVVYKEHTPGFMEFERKYNMVKPGFPVLRVVDRQATSHVDALKTGRDFPIPLVVTNPQGGYVADGYFCNTAYQKDSACQWYVNPFKFFSLAFATETMPKPDTTTLAGRRIYFSHVDGDGWRSMSFLEQYRQHPKTVTEVLLEHVYLRYPDLPVTIGAVAGDLSAEWYGNKTSRETARKIYALPYVEAGSHSFSHPYDWKFLENMKPEAEKRFAEKYKVYEQENHTHLVDWLGKVLEHKHQKKNGAENQGHEIFDTPRAYAKSKYSTALEIKGSCQEIANYLPEGKRVEVMMWTGNTAPYAEAIRMAREEKLRNINGGDSRFDQEYPSYAWVAPIGVTEGKERQIYAVCSNENTYTELWSDRFYGFKYLKNTLKNTENPIRVKPINIYYHMYTGERLASLNALLENLEYVRKLPVCPIKTSTYCAIADGFYTTELISIGDSRWRIRNRDGLQTLRFDHATLKTVDLAKSDGVVGLMHLHGSLYVYLDKAVAEPVVALKNNPQYWEPAVSENRSYLLGSRWQVSDFSSQREQFNFTAWGFGKCDMTWVVPENGTYTVKVDGKESFNITVLKHKLSLNIELKDIQKHRFEVFRERQKVKQ